MSDTVEVEREYLEALETLAIGRIRHDSDVTRKEYRDALKRIKSKMNTK